MNLPTESYLNYKKKITIIGPIISGTCKPGISRADSTRRSTTRTGGECNSPVWERGARRGSPRSSALSRSSAVCARRLSAAHSPARSRAHTQVHHTAARHIARARAPTDTHVHVRTIQYARSSSGTCPRGETNSRARVRGWHRRVFADRYVKVYACS